MPKIPTYTATTRPTAEVPSTKTDVTVDPRQNLASITAPVNDYLTKVYVKEKKQEANNKATRILSDLYIDQDDGTKGFYSIQSETSTNSNPTDASASFDNGVDQLWQYTKNNKLKEFDNFTKKALENKFYSTAGLFKIKSLENSRNEQIKETRNVADDFILKDALALKLNGITYLDAYEQNVNDIINKHYTDEDDGIKKKDTQAYLSFGQNQLAKDLAVKQPQYLKANINKLNALTNTQKTEVLALADKQILENRQVYFTSDLSLTEDSTTQSIINNYDEIEKGTFNGDIDKIKLWQSLPENEKRTIIDYAKKTRRSNTAELNNRNTAALNENKQKAINFYQQIYGDSDTLETLTELKINNILGEPKNDYERNAKSQIVELSTKIGQKEFSNVNNYYKNFDIQKGILSGQITDHITPFMLEGETAAKSITERVGDGISKKEFGFYLNYLLPNRNNKQFIDNHKKLYTVIEKLQPYIQGESSLQYLDTTVDNRLNNFQSQMIFNFAEAIKRGETNINDILNMKSKNFILKNLSDYKPNKDLITKIISEKSTESVEGETILPPPWNPTKHKNYNDYINSPEYQNYLQQKKEQ